MTNGSFINANHLGNLMEIILKTILDIYFISQIMQLNILGKNGKKMFVISVQNFGNIMKRKLYSYQHLIYQICNWNKS